MGVTFRSSVTVNIAGPITYPPSLVASLLGDLGSNTVTSTIVDELSEGNIVLSVVSLPDSFT
uniref:Uncharacterized protein n=1 Tax=Rhizophora mucronata TaxID=61149 RepID=A0A2P2IH03_RHIMU